MQYFITYFLYIIISILTMEFLKATDDLNVPGFQKLFAAFMTVVIFTIPLAIPIKLGCHLWEGILFYLLQLCAAMMIVRIYAAFKE